MNSVNLIGRLTADPWMKSLEEGNAITKFTIAVDRGYSSEKKEQLAEEGKQTADFPQVVVWGKLAETCGKVLVKGLQIGVSGSIQTSSFDTVEGDTVYTTFICGKSIKFLEFPSQEE